MSRVVLVDSNVLLASRDLDSDQRFERAQAIVSGIDEGELPTAHVTDYVVAETLNLLHARGYHRTAVEYYDGLVESAGFETHRTTAGDYDAGVELFRERDSISFVDAVLLSYMQRTGISYVYTFDSEFSAVQGVTVLDTAVDPFE